MPYGLVLGGKTRGAGAQHTGGLRGADTSRHKDDGERGPAESSDPAREGSRGDDLGEEFPEVWLAHCTVQVRSKEQDNLFHREQQG